MIDTSVFVHDKALVDSVEIGEGTRVWAFAHIMEGATVGRNCNICEHVFIESGVEIGDGVVVKNGVCLWDGIKLENKVFVGPAAIFINDNYPRSKAVSPDWTPLKTVVRQGASIGANATILGGLEIGCYAMVAAASVVTRSVPDFALVCGNPAVISGYVCKCAKRLKFIQQSAECICGRAYLLYARRGKPNLVVCHKDG